MQQTAGGDVGRLSWGRDRTVEDHADPEASGAYPRRWSWGLSFVFILIRIHLCSF